MEQAVIDSDAEQEIIKLAQEWIEAIGKRDRAALERILHPDFLIAGWLPNGRLGDRGSYLEDCLRPISVEQASYGYEQWQFRFYGHIAVVNCIFTCQALVAGKQWGGVFLFTDVWIKRSERWQVATRHSSPVFDQQEGM